MKTLPNNPHRERKHCQDNSRPEKNAKHPMWRIRPIWREHIGHQLHADSSCCRNSSRHDKIVHNAQLSTFESAHMSTGQTPKSDYLFRRAGGGCPRGLNMGNVRRQSFWDRERLKIRESLARLVFNVMRPADGAASGDWRLSFV